MTRVPLAIIALGGFAVLCFFASVGVAHLFGTTAQIVCIPIFTIGGLLLGSRAYDWSHR